MLSPRVVIPEAVHRAVLDNLLMMHQGATNLRQRVRLAVFWPSMDSDILTAFRTYRSCTLARNTSRHIRRNHYYLMPGPPDPSSSSMQTLVATTAAIS